MDVHLTLNEARVVGCLLEKESTTPDQYPLTLNALVNACNQKSSRDPVLSLTSAEVTQALNNLIDQRLVSEESGSRTCRYKHRFCNTAFSHLQLSEQERAIVCLMLLRGAQTPGEFRSRSGRMATFGDVSDVESALQEMVSKELVVQLPREPGRRESRFAHLFSGEVDVPPAIKAAQSDRERIRELEQEVEELKVEVERLRYQLKANQ
ncbi:YceH family protein [Parendozoicomonas sp. Alg238-R29]|uniref:YceH family protein n=1 Tax=Parendozoicomonas sp. Alg238-R29 TaxID=2993446 RepID=UPI00248F1BB4|nr:YceH family protein [Parendozoicomonas sp. Alg238-R29]